MSWRPSNDFRSSNSYRGPDRKNDSALDPTMRLILIGGGAFVVLVIGIIIAINLFNRPSGDVMAVVSTSTPVVVSPTSAALTPTVKPTTASVIVSARGTPTPAPTVSPADAGPLETNGDAEAGRTLFNNMPAEAISAGAVACYTCHNVDPGSATLVGPSLSGVGVRAATRVSILSPAQYLRTSIVAPNSYVVEGFAPGIMTQTFEQALSPEQIEDLVAYLLTLKE
ncbi:c-type cytochrome [Candidatus Oscillochloris fontis]|uniref:c-type cytochrome n=1 Tax=Candidatus Oscillochloris fontis TaxID=2496868 RepID=UPI00101CC498|nr:cytochrome c [Candidatus Oscillochloris fontis]